MRDLERITTMTKPFQMNVSSMYGAPMGRRSSREDEFVGKSHLQRVPFVDGDYDQGGAYWGRGYLAEYLYCAWDDEGHAIYCRAKCRADAKAALTSLKFYR